MKNKIDLLDEVRKIKVKKRHGSPEITREMIDVAMAWARGEVTLTQIEMVLFKKSGGAKIYVLMAKALAEYIKYEDRQNARK